MSNFLTSPFILAFIPAVIATWNAVRNSNYRRLWQMCSTMLWSGLGLRFAGEMGTTIDQNGIVHELGLVLPIGGAMFCVGLIIFGILNLLNLFTKRASSKNPNS